MSSRSRTPASAHAIEGMNSICFVPAGISKVFAYAFQPSEEPFQGPAVTGVFLPSAPTKFIMMRASCQFSLPTLTPSWRTRMETESLPNSPLRS